MSAAPWKTATRKPYGFRVTIERQRSGSRELHTFLSKTPRPNVAAQAATYKEGFIRLVRLAQLSREEWDREFGIERAGTSEMRGSAARVAGKVRAELSRKAAAAK